VKMSAFPKQGLVRVVEALGCEASVTHEALTHEAVGCEASVTHEALRCEASGAQACFA
jgi:hypothetical protein